MGPVVGYQRELEGVDEGDEVELDGIDLGVFDSAGPKALRYGTSMSAARPAEPKPAEGSCMAPLPSCTEEHGMSAESLVWIYMIRSIHRFRQSLRGPWKALDSRS